MAVFALSCNWFHRLHTNKTNVSVWQFISHWASQHIFFLNRIRVHCKEEGHLGVLTLKLDLLHLQKLTLIATTFLFTIQMLLYLWALQTVQVLIDCEQNLTQCEFATTCTAVLDSPASFKMSPRTQTQPSCRSITLQYKQTETFPFGNRIRQSQLIYNREMSNWARSILIGYTSPAFAFSNWYVSPDPESSEVNLKTFPETGSSHPHFLDLTKCWFEFPIQNLNIGLPPLFFFCYMQTCSGIAQTSHVYILCSWIILRKPCQGFWARVWLFNDQFANAETWLSKLAAITIRSQHFTLQFLRCHRIFPYWEGETLSQAWCYRRERCFLRPCSVLQDIWILQDSGLS